MNTNKIFINITQRAHKFTKIYHLIQKIPDMPLTAEVKDALDEYAKRLGLPKADPEAWREEYRKKQAAGVRFEYCGWCKDMWFAGIYEFNGNKEDYREVPQEVQKEGDMRIPEASEIRKWADRYYSLWCFVENSLPRDASSDTFDIFRGYARQVNDEIYGVTDKAKEPHAAERALWKAQREAGTNEVWQWAYVDDPKKIWTDIRVDHTPTWQRIFIYRAKPMKLTAKIIRRGVYKTSYYWEFFGTREEYRAECEKYGYVVVSNIEEVKPKTVKNYSVLVRVKFPTIEAANAYVKDYGMDIIGDIEEREIEA